MIMDAARKFDDLARLTVIDPAMPRKFSIVYSVILSIRLSPVRAIMLGYLLRIVDYR